jgi:beta-glucosidase
VPGGEQPRHHGRADQALGAVTRIRPGSAVPEPSFALMVTQSSRAVQPARSGRGGGQDDRTVPRPAADAGGAGGGPAGRVTLREKVGQLNQRLLRWQTWKRSGTGFELTAASDEELDRWGGLGALYGLQRADAWSGRDWSTGIEPAADADLAAAVQQMVAASRWGIPALLVEEAPHGHQALGSQLYPTNLAAAASWRPDLVELAAVHTGDQLRARGVQLALVSGLDLLRDPRWGRGEECFGDPLLACLFVRALVRGLRSGGPTLGGGDQALRRAGSGRRRPERVRRTDRAPRAGRAAPARDPGRDRGRRDRGDGRLQRPGRRPVLRRPTAAHRPAADGWGFDGIVMADMFAVDRLRWSVPADGAAALVAAGALALRSGVDLSMCDVAFTALEQAVADGLVAEYLVDRACRRCCR